MIKNKRYGAVRGALVGLGLLFAVSCQQAKEQEQATAASRDWAGYVNPLIGTESSFALSNGNTYPIISRPWGLNSWTPQTGKMGDGWQYTYDALKIRGFKQTHQPSPWINDYGQFAIMPQLASEPKVDQDQRASYFSHKTEQVHPYAYEVYLADYDLNAHMAPTDRAAVFEFDFPKESAQADRWLIVDAFDAGGELEKVDEHTLYGISRKNSGGVPENFANYFVVITPDKITSIHKADTTGNGGSHARWALQTDGAEKMRVYVASSFISHEQALLNAKEVLGRSYQEVSEEGRNRWNELLGRLAVTDAREDKKEIFYSSLYRCLLFPRDFSEIDAQGQRMHYSPYNGQVLPGYMYTDTGVWDTFRALFPLINLVYPDEASKMQEGFLNAALEGDFFPEWASPGHRDCMVGNNSASVVSDGLQKGLLDSALYDKAIEKLLYSANHNHPQIKSTGRYGVEYYNKLGYVPYNVGINENAARTLEYAYDDWAIAQALRKVNAPDSLTNLYLERAQNYRKLFDKETGWMRGRNEDGSFQAPFNPFKWGDAFTEGNAVHYTWSVFHDVAGLIDLMGGEERFSAKLDTVFALPPVFDDSYYGFVIHEIREMQIMDMGNYAHGNQPIQHMIYLYPYAGVPSKAQYHVRQVMNRLYTALPDGYCGDEDNGQTSAWYVFSALGFYPVTPASNQYVIGVPYFDKVEISIPDRPTTTIEADHSRDTYIQSVSWDGKAYPKPYLTYEQLREGGLFKFTLGDKPTSWGADKEWRPYSMSTEKKD